MAANTSELEVRHVGELVIVDIARVDLPNLQLMMEKKHAARLVMDLQRVLREINTPHAP